MRLDALNSQNLFRQKRKAWHGRRRSESSSREAREPPAGPGQALMYWPICSGTVFEPSALLDAEVGHEHVAEQVGLADELLTGSPLIRRSLRKARHEQDGEVDFEVQVVGHPAL